MPRGGRELRWRGATAIVVGALVVLAGASATVLLLASSSKESVSSQERADGAAQRSTSGAVAGVPLPVDWKSAPVVARGVTTTSSVHERDVGSFGATFVDRGMLGDVPVAYEVDACTIGGSACAQSRPRFHHLRVGDLDDGGWPTIEACAERCDATSFDALTLRRTADGGVSIVSLADADGGERPLVALTRLAR